MYRRFSSVNGQLKMYTGDTAQKTAANRSVALRRMVEQFSDKDKYEFMLLDSYGGVIASSSGTDAEGILSSVDFERAQENADGMGMAIYRTASNEMVMAVCCLVPYAAEDVAAMRLVTSLTLIQNQMKSVVLISIVVMVVILGFTVASGLYFVRSIVRPAGAGGTHRCLHRAGRTGCPPARDRRQPRRGGPPARHHQPDGRGAGQRPRR